jgi:hypothetical protein
LCCQLRQPILEFTSEFPALTNPGPLRVDFRLVCNTYPTIDADLKQTMSIHYLTDSLSDIEVQKRVRTFFFMNLITNQLSNVLVLQTGGNYINCRYFDMTVFLSEARGYLYLT